MGGDLALFGAAFAVSAVLPGPDTMLLAIRAMATGARSAVPVAVGVTAGKVVLLSAAVAGVAATAAALGPAFVAFKIAGGVYLVWLAVRLWRRAGQPVAAPAAAHGTATPRTGVPRAGAAWRGAGFGALMTMSNPQALLFYLAVLPAVLGSPRVTFGEYLLLCLTLCAVMGVVAAGYIGAAARLRTTLTHSRRRLADRAAAVLLALTGTLAASR